MSDRPAWRMNVTSVVSVPPRSTHRSTRPFERLVPAVLMLLVAASSGCRCSKDSSSTGSADGATSSADAGTGATSSEGTSREPGTTAKLSAPIAAARLEGGDVVVAGLDVPSKAIRVQKIASNDAVTEERTIFEGIAWSSDAELKVTPVGAGFAVTWRGKRAGRPVRQSLFLGNDLVPKGDPVDVAVGSCATRDALWFTDGRKIEARSWAGTSVRASLPKDDDASLVCGAHRAFALLDQDDGTTLWFLGATSLSSDAGVTTAAESDHGSRPSGATRASAAASAAASAVSAHGASPALSGPIPLLKESDFGEDEQRERAEYTVGDDIGVVRLGASGGIAIREVVDKNVGPLRRLKSVIGRDDDVVAVDASSRAVVIVYTDDASEGCSVDGSPSSKVKVMALRVDRQTFDESTFELSAGECGREVGPFFTGVRDEGVSVAWVERIPVVGKTSAPIAGLAHRFVPPGGAPGIPLARVDQPADALVDAGCDAAHCYAVALARKPGADVMVPGFARVLRYP